MGDHKDRRRATGWIRATDLLVVLGIAMGAAGAAIFRFGAGYVSAWIAWLVAPLLWYGGLGLLLGWALTRIFVTHTPLPEEKQIPHHPANAQASNFFEHDINLEPMKEIS